MVVRRFTGPGWRVAGSAASWLLFTFCFLSLYQVAAVVTGLGGFCASGGPYVIETECPESVVIFAPFALPGMFAAAGLGLIFARGFGTPLIVWAWPILFIGLGIQFGIGALRGDVVGIILGVLFLAMGAVPLVFELRGGWRVVRGSHNIRDERFADPRDARRTIYAWGGRDRGDDHGDTVSATPVDWLLSLTVLLLAVSLGTYLSLSAFNAVAAAG